MAENVVTPWRGTLEWVGEPIGGTTQKGEWKSVDFTIKYVDPQGKDKFATFSTFGVERVNWLLELPLGSELSVVWVVESYKSKRDGRYFPKNTALTVRLAVNTQGDKEDASGTEPHVAYYNAPAGTPEADLPF